ncbi:MAG TPA: hypothetical protein VLW50_00615 [Streptosporangiaceae bacterium]|nr:hypothetical protein [Streptosporangiaceae bacterium]
MDQAGDRPRRELREPGGEDADEAYPRAVPLRTCSAASQWMP